MLYEYRIYLTSAAFGGAQWFNRLVFDTALPPEATASRALCMQLLNAWRALHLPIVELQQVGVFLYDHAMEKRGDQTPFVFHAQRAFQSVPRVQTIPAQPHVGLQLNKPVALGRGGKQWLFGCLNDTDFEDGLDGQPILTAVSEFQQLVQFWLVDGLASFPFHQLVVPPRALGVVYSAPIVPTYFALGHPIKARARARSRSIVPPARWSRLYNVTYIGQKADALSEAIEYQIATGTDYLDSTLKARTLELVSYVSDFCGVIIKIIEGEQIDDSDDLYIPLSRWGQQPQAQVRYAGDVKVRYQEAIQFIEEIKPYTYAGDEYITLENMTKLQEVADEFVNYAAGIMDMDYATPYSVKLDGTPE